MKRKLLILAAALFTIGASHAAKQSSFEEIVGEFASQFSEECDQIKGKPAKGYKRTIYIDAAAGKDSNSGSQKAPIKSLEKLAQMKIKSGDQILLKGGESYPGTIELDGLNKIYIGSYGDSKAWIDCKGYPSGVTILNSSNVVVSDLKIKGDGGAKNSSKMYRASDAKVNYRAGIFLRSSGGVQMDNITLYNVDIRDVYFYNIDDEDIPHDERPCRKWGIKHSNNFSWGIKGEAKGGAIKNLTIDDCHIKAVSRTAIQLNGNKGRAPFDNLHITNCSIIDVGGPGMMFSGATNALINRNRTLRSGSCKDPRMWGRGSGSWLVGSVNLLYEQNFFERAEGIGDCCGVHIDIGNKDVVVQRCLSKDNAGGFIEVLGKNENCSYRYNLSINDGWRNPAKDPKQKEFWRVKKEVANSKELFADNAAGSLGCILTVNGHAGKSYIGPYNSYIYNNTIVCSESRVDGFQNPYVFQIATTAEGVLLMNNIFWVPAQFEKGWSVHAYKNGEFHSKAYDFRTPTGELIGGKKPVVRDMNEAELKKADVVMRNNLYQLYDPKFPKAENALPNRNNVAGTKMGYFDGNALGGDPRFAKGEDWQRAEDLIPTDRSVVERGEEVTKLKGDKSSYGVLPKLKMEQDFFGRPITTPIIGACVVVE